jgi:hypothetical protein
MTGFRDNRFPRFGTCMMRLGGGGISLVAMIA